MNTADTLPADTIAARIAEVQARVRGRPDHADTRAELFQWLAVRGDWLRAAAQLEACAELAREAGSLCAAYRPAIEGERQREAVFAGTRPPRRIAAEHAWLDELALALQPDAPAAALARAGFAAAPASAATVVLADGTHHAVNWLADADSRLGPVCEVIVEGGYGWVPFADLAHVRIAPPQGLCDLVWARAGLTLRDGTVVGGLIPARYPAPPAEGYAGLDDGANLGRRTDWRELGDERYAGIGQRMWVGDTAEFAMLDVREVHFTQAAPA